jgi:O-antigen/teichoic acid export membrane protein
LLAELANSRFVRNVAIVATGTAGAQAITMAFAPVITRLYGPEAYGVLGAFTAILNIMTPLTALTYPIAIVLPKNNADAIGLVKLSLAIALITSLSAALALVIFKEPIIRTFNLQAIESFILLLPLAMMFSAFLAAASQYVIRHKLFKTNAKIAVLQSLFVNGTKAGFGLFIPAAAVLVAITTLGSALHALLLYLGVKKTMPDSPAKPAVKPLPLMHLAYRHRDFAYYRTPQIFINAISQSMPVLLLAALFGPAAAGFYSLGKMVLGAPTTLIGQSVASVFYPRVNEAVLARENPYRLVLKATLSLAGAGAFPFGIIVVFGPWLFSFVFGDQWVIAGEYARWLSVYFFFNFINKPSVATVPVIGIQKGLLVYELFSTTGKAVGLLIGFYYFKSDMAAVALFSVIGALAYFSMISWIIYRAKAWVAHEQAG